ncbi:MAG: NAD(P)-dependent oxidoreductase [Legionellaceae bacterium]|nr:NAD(P)-dependent oxidoreductase [Legionellaceae bacterium]
MSSQQKRVLLTGALGFVGRQIARFLSEKEVEIVLVVREGKEAQASVLPGVSRVIITPDLFTENVRWWADVCSEIDIVIHAAWYTEPGKYLQSPLNFECLTGTLNLAKGAAQANVKRFVGVGTCFEYDLTQAILSVDTPLKPTTPYAAAKAATYLTLSQYLSTEGMAFVWCRLFYLYGPGEDSKRFVPYLRAQLEAGQVAELTTGKQIRDFLNVVIAGQMVVDTALSDQQGTVNICSGIPITVRQLAEKIAAEYGRLDLLKFGCRQDNLVDPPCLVGLPGNNTITKEVV